jgi:hypothetical protein
MRTLGHPFLAPWRSRKQFQHLSNMVRPGGADVAAYGRAVRGKPGISSVLLPVGAGLDVSRFDPA